MTIREEYEAFLKNRQACTADPLFCRFLNQAERYITPFRVYGKIYYVGDTWVCAYLVDTGRGLLLIDGGNCGDAAKLIDNIWRLGFDPAKIRWMVVSHGHVDHFGVANYLKTVYDTKLFMGAPDAEMLKKEPELTLIQNSNDLSEIIPEVDVPIHDCDEINFGNLKARFRLVPGHTDGSIAMFFDMEEDGVIRHVGYYGGLGLNTMEREYLLQRGDPNCEKRKEYLQSIESVRDEAVDVVLGNHTEHGDVLDKRKRQLAGYYGNPFIDPTDWNRLLDEWSEKMKALMRSENQPL